MLPIPSVLLLSALVRAQYDYGPADDSGSSDSTSSAARAVPSAPADTTGSMNIDVGFKETFTFNPNNITAPNGTIVTFFFPNNGIFNHSVTQSAFDDPCFHLEATGDTPAGFDSGLVGGVQFSINITDDTQPIYFHCKQVLHCGMGMVGAINAPTTGDQTFEAFMGAAKAIGSDQPTETDQGFVPGGVGAEATAAPAVGASGPAEEGSAVSLGVTLLRAVLICGLVQILVGSL